MQLVLVQKKITCLISELGSKRIKVDLRIFMGK